MGRVIRIGRVSQPAGEKDNIPAGELIPVLRQQSDAADPACVQAAPVNDGFTGRKICGVKILPSDSRTAQSGADPPGILLGEAIF